MLGDSTLGFFYRLVWETEFPSSLHLPLKQPTQDRGFENTSLMLEMTGVSKRHRRHHRDEMRRARRGGHPLHRSWVRETVGSYLPVDVGLRREPFNRIVAVRNFLQVRIESAPRLVLPTDILKRHYITTLGCTYHKRIDGFGLVVRGAHEQRRISPGIGRTVDVGVKGNAVAHFYRHVSVDHDVVAPPRIARGWSPTDRFAECQRVHTGEGDHRDEEKNASLGQRSALGL